MMAARNYDSALVVTRAQTRKQEQEDMEARQREAEDEVHPEPLLEDDTMDELSESDLRNSGAEDRMIRKLLNIQMLNEKVWTVIWVTGPFSFMQVSKDKKKLTRAEKRQQRQEFTKRGY